MSANTSVPRHCQLMAPADDPQEFIASSIYWYPSIFPTRTEVLDHTLLCNGNGYEWGPDGNIWSVFAHIEPDYDDRVKKSYLSEALKLEARGAVVTDPATRELYLKWAAEERAEDARLEGIRADYLHLARTYGPIRDREQDLSVPGGYQARTIGAQYLSRWTLLGRVPENVTPAWRAITEETLDLFRPLFTEQGELF